jgi:hypothetical protein
VNLPENSNLAKLLLAVVLIFSVLFLMNKLKMKKGYDEHNKLIMKMEIDYAVQHIDIQTHYCDRKVIRNVNVVHSP